MSFQINLTLASGKLDAGMEAGAAQLVHVWRQREQTILWRFYGGNIPAHHEEIFVGSGSYYDF